MRYLIVLSLLPLVAACAEPPPANDIAAASQATRAASAPATAPAAAPRAVREETADYTFAFAYPAAAAAIPALDQWLRSQRDEERAGLARDAAQFRRETAAGGFPFRRYDLTTEWMVVTETPRLLSLSSEFYIYTGGAHGMTGHDALVWDKAAARRRAPIDLFTSPAALQNAVGARFCDLLDAERAKRRGAPVVRSGEGFDACIPISDAVLILGSTDRRHIDRLGFLVGPYAAGPYAEGSYDLTVAVTPAVLAAVRPEWRDGFRAGNGS